MAFNLSQKSLDKLKGVNPDLVRVVRRAIQISQVDFRVICGLRTIEEQKILVATGKSKTMASKHIVGRAVDVMAIVDGEGSWETHYYPIIAAAFKQAAQELKTPIVWGGDWKTFKDMDHFQLA